MAISLNDRLRQVIKPAGGAGAAVRTTADLELEGAAHRARSARSVRIDGHRVADVLAGQWIESDNGSVVVVDRYYAADRAHGRQRIGPIIEALEDGTDALQVLARKGSRNLEIEMLLGEPAPGQVTLVDLNFARRG